MPKIILALDSNKRLDGISETDKKRFLKFKFKIANLGDDSIAFSYHLPRSGVYHRRFFAQLSAIFENQDVFHDLDQMRLWAEVGSGFVEFYPMLDTGEMIAVPKSIAYDRLDQEEFAKVHDEIFAFIRSKHARNFLWPMMTDHVSEQMIDAVLGEFV